ncbi:MAG: hypothetical protein L0H73_09795 [Nitrococcus sp.]|nr:hypothetical protein [Nitrococcus sp.]
MTDKVENLILEHLRAIRADIATVKNDTREIKQRLTSLETNSAGQRRDTAQLYGDIADQHARYDRLTERVERIERRLEIQNET